MSSSSADIQFSDTTHAFAYKSDKDLKKANFLFSMMGNKLVLQLGLKMIPVCIRFKVPFVRTLVKQTIFNQFVGGETLEDTNELVEKLASFGVQTILDYGVEGKEMNDDAYDAATTHFLQVIQHAAGHRQIPFISIKLTGITRPQLLEKMDGFMRNSEWPLLERYQRAMKKLNEEEHEEWERFLNRVEQICSACSVAQIGIWMDAEESWMQEPMDAVALMMMQQFNRLRPVVYNTYQMYRHDRLSFLKENHQAAQLDGFILGAKLVRGAYMEKEWITAFQREYQSPIQADKASTDRDFNAAVEYCIDHIDSISVALGTHNENSTQLGAGLMLEKGLAPNHPHVHFAQLLGMSDNISFNLAAKGFNVGKYVPFGPLEDVIPYLMRRAEENSSVKGQTGRELSLIKSELKRRRQTS